MSSFENVKFFCREPDKDGIMDSFPVDSTKDTTTAEYWAKEERWNRETRKYESVSDGTCYEYPNVGFDNVLINSLEFRGNGGRAYKVVLTHDDKKFLVDFRESELMDVIKNTGIQAGGKLNGLFVFVKDGSQTKLTRIGSDLYNKFFKNVELSEKPKLKLSELQLNHVYKEKYRNLNHVYIGDIYVPKVKYDKNSNYRTPPVMQYEGIVKKRLFKSFYNSDDNLNYQELFDKSVNDSSFYSFIDNSSFIEDVGVIVINKSLEFYIDKLNKRYEDRWNNMVAQYPEKNNSYWGGHWNYPYASEISSDLSYLCASQDRKTCEKLLEKYKLDVKKMCGGENNGYL